MGVSHLRLMLTARAPLKKDEEVIARDPSLPLLLQQGGERRGGREEEEEVEEIFSSEVACIVRYSGKIWRCFKVDNLPNLLFW